MPAVTQPAVSLSRGFRDYGGRRKMSSAVRRCRHKETAIKQEGGRLQMVQQVVDLFAGSPAFAGK